MGHFSRADPGLFSRALKIPGPVKKAFAAFVVIGGSVVALLGAILIAKASIGLFVVGIKLLGLTVASVAATLLPAVLILGALAAAAAGFAIAVRRDIGGLGTFFERTYQRIKLFTDAMGQLLEQGGFSGAVRDELNRVENQGLKTFAIRVFQVVFRIKRFFGGLVDGFRDAIERSQLIFFRFTEALRQLWSNRSGCGPPLPSTILRGDWGILGAVPSAQHRR